MSEWGGLSQSGLSHRAIQMSSLADYRLREDKKKLSASLGKGALDRPGAKGMDPVCPGPCVEKLWKLKKDRCQIYERKFLLLEEARWAQCNRFVTGHLCQANNLLVESDEVSGVGLASVLHDKYGRIRLIVDQ